MQVQAVDQFHALTSILKTREFVASAVAQYEQQERDKASKVSAPKN
jgi:hypothetical protein